MSAFTRTVLALALRVFPPVVIALLVCLAPAASAAEDLATALMDSTFRISGPAGDGGDVTVAAGTVFLVIRPGKTSSGRSLVMVTAAHVLAGISGDHAVLLLRKRMPDGDMRSYEHSVRIRDKGARLWTIHPEADIAVLPLELPPETKAAPIAFDLLATDEVFSRYEIAPGDELLSLGFPFGLPANTGGYPVLRSGKIASYPLIPARKHRKFLYDVQVHSGNSGGPVFFAASSRTYGGSHKVKEISFIAGLVSTQAVVEGRPLELAAVVPAQFIRETIELLPPK